MSFPRAGVPAAFTHFSNGAEMPRPTEAREEAIESKPETDSLLAEAEADQPAGRASWLRRIVSTPVEIVKTSASLTGDIGRVAIHGDLGELLKTAVGRG